MAASLLSTLGWVLAFFFVVLEVYRQNFLDYADSLVMEFVVSRQYRSAYHFQPPQNWMKGKQADVKVEFELDINLNKAEPFDPNWLVDPSKLCHDKGPSVYDGVGPFGLLVLASHNLEEHTAGYFRVFNNGENYAVLMCTDQRKSSVRDELYKPAFGGFVDTDLKKDGKISLRTLIDHSIVESFGGRGKTCITSGVYPTFLAKRSVHLYALNNGTETEDIGVQWVE